MPEPDKTISCSNLDEVIEQHKRLGYRLDMIFPADDPREALISNSREVVRLVSSVVSPGFSRHTDGKEPPEGGTHSTWRQGRAGMMYRDLIPGRMDGKMAVSHIRLTEGGEVPDYVHYHKIDFQVIYCLKGRIKVVYEDQGEPFWLETGDWVIQPPEIRHRVLECEANSEVIEISMPAEHETWVERDITLPTAETKRDREYGGQRFVRYVANKKTG